MYDVNIKKSILKGEISAPPSKSISHRYLIGAALTKDKIRINNIAYSDDIKATIKSLKSLGCSINEGKNFIDIDAANFLNKNDNLDANESGSTLRFMIPLCLIDGKERIIEASEVLLTRPLNEYIKLCEENSTDDNECKLEIYKKFVKVKGRLNKTKYELSSALSSQFITGMIFALCYLREESDIKLIEDINSKSYIDMTIDVLNEIGFNIKWSNENSIHISEDFKLKKNIFTIEGDYSNTAFLDAFNTVNKDNYVKVLGLNNDSKQGDKIYKKYFNDIINSTPTLNVNDCPDLAPILIALSTIHNGARLIGTKRLKIKESDRSLSMKNELNKLGADIDIKDNEIIVYKSNIKTPIEDIDSHNDHRIVMAMSVLLSKVGGRIINANAVNKSYPEFFNDIKKIGANVDIVE